MMDEDLGMVIIKFSQNTGYVFERAKLITFLSVLCSNTCGLWAFSGNMGLHLVHDSNIYTRLRDKGLHFTKQLCLYNRSASPYNLGFSSLFLVHYPPTISRLQSTMHSLSC
jgi:hypothetical protein